MALFAILVVAAAAAQQPGRGRMVGSGGPGLRAAAPGELALAQDLVRQARAAAYAAPAWLTPRVLAEVARDEMREDPQQALADYRQAFALARALRPAADGDDIVGQGREQVKASVEMEAISALAQRGEHDDALSLARLADVPKAPLYDRLIEWAMRDGREGRSWRPPVLHDDNQPPLEGGAGEDAAADAAAERQQHATDAVLALVGECKRAGGSYPYLGVAMALRRMQWDPLDRILLVRDGYRYAASESDAGNIATASLLLRAGHLAEPALDGLLASTLTTLITRLAAQSPNDASAAAARRASSLMLSLLRIVSPAQAQAMTALFPNMAPAAAPAPAATSAADTGTGTGGGRGQRGWELTLTAGEFRLNGGLLTGGNAAPAFNFNVNVVVPADSDAQTAGNAQAFLHLLAAAEESLRRRPSESLGYANQASALLDEDLIEVQASAATRLALVYYELGDAGDGGGVLARCLAEADREGRLADAQAATADAAQLAQWMRGSLPYETTVAAVYSMAARLDFANTAQRAATAPFTLLKPGVLARVALVGAAAARRGGGGGR